MRRTHAIKTKESMTEVMVVSEVTCSECNKPISTIPRWLAGVKVKFQCEECRQKRPHASGFAEFEGRRTTGDLDPIPGHTDIVDDVVEDADEDAADDDMDDDIAEE